MQKKDYLNDIKIDSDYIYLAGSDYSLGNNHQLRIEKRNISDGGLVSTFGNNGVIVTNPSTGTDDINSIEIDDDYIYLGGYDSINLRSQWRIEKRDKTSGSLISAFGNNGIVSSDPSGSAGSDVINVIKTDSNYIYCCGYDFTQSDNSQWRIEKRDKTSGSLISAFGNNGIIQINYAVDPSTNDAITSIDIDSGNIYLGGYKFSNEQLDRKWIIEKRSCETGILIPDFGTNGLVELSQYESWYNAKFLKIKGNSLYSAVSDISISATDCQWRIEKMNK